MTVLGRPFGFALSVAQNTYQPHTAVQRREPEMHQRVRGLLGVWLDSGLLLGYEEFRRQQTRGRGIVAIDLSGGNSAMDYTQHARTYKQFLFFTKVAIVFLVLLLAGMAYFLV